MFTVSVSYNSACSDRYIFSHKSTLYNSAVFYYNAWHKNTVDDPGALAYSGTGEKYGIFDFAFYNTALSDKGLVNIGIGTNVLRKRRNIFGIDLPGRSVGFPRPPSNPDICKLQEFCCQQEV